jgi:hypothetical protein
MGTVHGRADGEIAGIAATLTPLAVGVGALSSVELINAPGV